MARGMRGLLLAAIAAAGAMIWAGIANAAELNMETGSRTTQPIGHYQFCRQYPDECRQRNAKPAPEPATEAFWKVVSRVNRGVNSQIRPRTDMEMWGHEEIWSFPVEFGDCEDYVIEKRRRLIAMGVPSGNLLITVLRQPNGDGHAVLTVRTFRRRLRARQSRQPDPAVEQHRIHLSETAVRTRLKRVAVDQRWPRRRGRQRALKEGQENPVESPPSPSPTTGSTEPALSPGRLHLFGSLNNQAGRSRKPARKRFWFAT